MPFFPAIALCAASSLVAVALATRAAGVQRLDDRLEEWVIAHRERVHFLASLATLPGEKFVHPVIAAITAATLLHARGAPATRFLLPLAAASLGGIIAHHLVKFMFHRPRPEGALRRDKTEAAFPSGHTTNATAVVTTSAYLLVREGLVPAPIALAAVVLIAACTGASRVALGWHWGTDVVGGWIAGIGVAALASSLYEFLSRT